MLTAVAVATLWSSTAAASPSLTASGLKTTGLSEPLGIGDRTPDFSWKLSGSGRAAAQSAYEIRVAAAESQLTSGPYLWQSGKVSSVQAIGRRLRGRRAGIAPAGCLAGPGLGRRG